jgi:hypothetical protein
VALLRTRQRWTTLTALGVVALHLSTVTHLALERHTVASSGALVELRDESAAHAHDERSLCDGAGLEVGQDAGPCLVVVEALATDDASTEQRPPQAWRMIAVPVDRVAGTGQRLWRLAPKASPPAA